MPRLTLEDLNLAAATKRIAEAALAEAGSIVETAQLMGITRQRLKRIMLEHRIEWPRGYRGER